MNPSLVIRVPETNGPTRTAFNSILEAGEFRDAHDPEWPELIAESDKYAVRINLYRDDLVDGRHGRYTFEFEGEDPKAVAAVREEFNAELAAKKLHAPK
jgi:hypothetical protein